MKLKRLAVVTILLLVAAGHLTAAPVLDPKALTLIVTAEPLPDGAVTLEATLTNTGTVPLLIDLFGELNELYTWKRKATYITSCWMLSWEGGRSSPGRHMGRAPLLKEQFMVLEPGRTYTKRLTVAPDTVATGGHRFRIAYTPRSSCSTFSVPSNWLEEQSLPTTAPLWNRMIFSNEVDVPAR